MRGGKGCDYDPLAHGKTPLSGGCAHAQVGMVAPTYRDVWLMQTNECL